MLAELKKETESLREGKEAIRANATHLRADALQAKETASARQTRIADLERDCAYREPKPVPLTHCAVHAALASKGASDEAAVQGASKACRHAAESHSANG